MSNDYSTEIREAEIVAAVLAVLLWPAAATIDIVTGVSVITPVAAFGVFGWIGGWDVGRDFAAFSKAYLSAGLTLAALTVAEREIIKSRLAAEGVKIETSLETAATAYGQKWAGKSLKQWCAANGTSFIGKMVCALNFTSIGINNPQ